MRKLLGLLAIALVIGGRPATVSAQLQQFAYGQSGSLFAQLLLQSSSGSTTTIAVDQGWYYSPAGIHDPTNTNYITGLCTTSCGSQPGEYRSFFVFDVPLFANVLTGATLRLNTAQVVGTPLINFYDVVTPTAALRAGAGTVGYVDLGSGVQYGARQYTAADAGQWRDITLNAAGVLAVQASQGNPFAIGGALGVAVVPEPASMILLSTGLLAIGGAAARRRNRTS